MGDTESRGHLVHEIFKEYKTSIDPEAGLTPNELQCIHSDLRLGSISIPQIEASVEYVCINDTCEETELYDLLQEMDRRHFLIQNFRWEFSLLDTERKNAITESQARWFVQMVHGEFFSETKWGRFLRSRAVPGSHVTFAEIEVMLCNIPSLEEALEDERERKIRQQEKEEKQREVEAMINKEKQRRKSLKEDEQRRLDQLANERQASEDKRRAQEQAEKRKAQLEKEAQEKRLKKLEEDEERGRQEAEEREKRQREQEALEAEKRQELLEAQRLREMEEKYREEEEAKRLKDENEAKQHMEVLRVAIANEKQAQEDAERARKKAHDAVDERTKKEAEEEERNANLRARENHNKRIRYKLKVAVKTRDLDLLPSAVDEFKKAKLPDDDKDLEKAERILKEEDARKRLRDAIKKRSLKDLESSIAHAKKGNFELVLAKDLIEANKVLLQVRRLERIRAEILELKQSTVAEIRSYQKPPPIVHTVMTGTFLLLGHQEKETKVWKNVQALVGKTGKEGLKRRCLGLEPAQIKEEAAKRCKQLLEEFDLDDVRDVSAGAATFYVWSTTMIEELEQRLAAIAAGIDVEDRPKPDINRRRSVSQGRRTSQVANRRRSQSEGRKKSIK